MVPGNQIILFLTSASYERELYDSMADEFPTPRRSSAMFIFRRQLILWGGLTQVFIGEGEEQFMYDSDIPGNLCFIPTFCGPRTVCSSLYVHGIECSYM